MPTLFSPTRCPKCGHDLPDSLSKRARIIDTIKAHPDLALKRIAWMYEVSTRLITQCAKEAGVQRKRGGSGRHNSVLLDPPPTPACPRCSAPIPDAKRNMSGDVVRFIRTHPDSDMMPSLQGSVSTSAR